MKKFIAIFLLLPLSAFSQIASGSKDLAWCEGVYLYYAHYSQISNNEGAAKNLLYRSSRVTTANLFLNLENGEVSGDKVRQFKEVKKDQKSMFDSNPKKYAETIAECDAIVPKHIANARSMNQKFDGKSFDALQQIVFDRLLSTMGIR